MFIIYALIDPRNTTVHYVGMTNDIVERLIIHLRCGEANREKNSWILDLKLNGRVPICRTLQTCDTEREAREAERKWIQGFLELDEPLCNVERTGGRRQIIEEDV